ncbi:HAMP domain-containing protein [Alginatibacterium sediminis]|uniref:histidine kinase n=1 Tax=Alginatibacterium sediminis TaxID=2164068 RepID=A0A420E6J1_9ALTE|nr:ATP-binding protein [Alginatibacterium sediminis]RKF13316.1 HAMP domain-containing protein [Alginatibacterium sediminis]
MFIWHDGANFGLSSCEDLKSLFNSSTSIRRLSFMALATLGIPLLVSLIFAMYSLQKISIEGQRAAFQVAQLVSNGKQLDELLLNMERNARQYFVLGDTQLERLFEEQLEELSQWPEGNFESQENQQTLELMVLTFNQVWVIAQQVNQQPLSAGEQQQVSMLLQKLKRLNDVYQTRIQQQVVDQASAVKQGSSKAQQQILWSILFLPLVIFAAISFVWFITRPIKQLGQQIKALELGDFETPIVINGPADVAEIALALDQMRARLQFLETQKNRFIRHISHELKTPLAAIREGNELLYDHSLGGLNERQHEVCQILQENSLKLQRHIEDLLNFNHIIDNSISQSHQSVSLGELFDVVLKSHQLTINNKQLDLQVNLDSLRVSGNQEQLRVIFDNLVSNAIKFSPRQGVIIIDSKIDNNGLACVVIEDQAGGIDEVFQAQMFEPFSQNKHAIEVPLKGSGLGLTIVKELIDRHQASLCYRRSELGSIFEICGFKYEQS